VQMGGGGEALAAGAAVLRGAHLVRQQRPVHIA
jgi:hypothetical protein